MRSTQANNAGFYSASRTCSVSADFSVKYFPSQKPSQISKKHLHSLIQINSLIILAQIKTRCSLCAPPTMLQLKWEQAWFPTFRNYIFEYNQNPDALASMEKGGKPEVAFCCCMLLYVFLITSSLVSWKIHNIDAIY